MLDGSIRNGAAAAGLELNATPGAGGTSAGESHLTSGLAVDIQGAVDGELLGRIEFNGFPFLNLKQFAGCDSYVTHNLHLRISGPDHVKVYGAGGFGVLVDTARFVAVSKGAEGNWPIDIPSGHYC